MPRPPWGSPQACKGVEKVLGVARHADSDSLMIDIEPIFKEALCIEPTKRRVINIICKIYDPLGIISPVVIKLKIFFQELCLAKLMWDEPFNDTITAKWESLWKDIQLEEPLNIPRCYMPELSGKIRLIGFCDASRTEAELVAW